MYLESLCYWRAISRYLNHRNRTGSLFSLLPVGRGDVFPVTEQTFDEEVTAGAGAAGALCDSESGISSAYSLKCVDASSNTWNIKSLQRAPELLPPLAVISALTSSSLIRCGQVRILGIGVFDPCQPLEPGVGGRYSYLKTESVQWCTELCGLKSIKGGWSESKAHHCFCLTVLVYFKCWFWALVSGTSRQTILHLVQLSFVPCFTLY